MQRILTSLCLLLVACSGRNADGRAQSTDRGTALTALPPNADHATRRAHEAELDREFPLHGLVTGLQLVIRLEPLPTATVLGRLRIGARLRLKGSPTRTSTCATGWYAIYPRGYACAGEGIEVAQSQVESPVAVPPPSTDAALPYQYYFVKDELVPEYHQLPSRDQQRETRDYVEHYLALRRQSPERAARFLRGEIPGELPKPAIVRGFLDRGFFIAAAGVDTRASRRFIRTVRGRYIKESQLEARRASQFHGIELDAAHTLPIAWAVREGLMMSPRTLPDGSTRFADDPSAPAMHRTDIVQWSRRQRVGDRMLHVLADGHYVRDWYLAVAEPVRRPQGVRADETWVHVDVGEQTLVVYRGDSPIYATLVSTGLVGHDTPVGLFAIREKFVADTMSDIGADAGDNRYSIEDVPWTQYFSGSLALHGAFWHERFGLKRSHGCVNLAPLDAHHVFNLTTPEMPENWHGITTDHTGLRGSHVYITE
ncbi:MAG: L,D-transpeptidase [Sandaracinaceae bacterium]|nr:L,D-transpeptidase [Sandaracinaceae bacterium]